MSVRKRTWTYNGETKATWVVNYTDAGGVRRLETFKRKRDADARYSEVAHQVRQGTHTPNSASITVAKAGEQWLRAGEDAGLERASLDRDRRHLNLHIIPFLGAKRLSQLTAPSMRTFEDDLRANGRSPAMVRGILSSLGAILADAQGRGDVAQNVVHARSKARVRGKSRSVERRQRGELHAGKDFPTPAEIKQLIPHLTGRWKPLLLTAAFTGLRASELRGLRWGDIVLPKPPKSPQQEQKSGEIHVRQRADAWNAIGAPKSKAGTRTVPIAPMLVKILREWKLACPNGEHGLVFPNGVGGIESHQNIVQRGLQPAMVAAGLTKKNGKAKYTGLHALRHFYASWCINRRVDGGLELPLKVVQARLGHSSITMTADRYGHLFPRGDDGAEMAAAERAILG